MTEPDTEADKREVLRAAIAAREAAGKALDEATAAHARAIVHEAQCRDRLASYATLAEEIDQAAIAALRTRGHAAHAPDGLRARLYEQSMAEAEHHAALHAVGTFASELAGARDEDERSEVGVTKALRGVTDVGRQRLQEELTALQRKVAAYEQAIAWGDGSETWRGIAAGLLADPLAAPLDVVVPDAPVPAPAPPRVVVDLHAPTVRLMHPDGSSEVVTSEEQAARDRGARVTAASSAASPMLAEEIARQRSRRSL